ncbi:MAG TPA: sugar ABC transporter ATP-binding protein [Trebonia sp.]|nr:sugar ABC transporter ATP-binding protein [Trebonia sp.]
MTVQSPATSGGAQGALPPLVAAIGVAKSFGATRALVRADLDLRPGEVHTVMGENGSGKSTLVKILAGVHRADSGSLTIDGVPADDLRSPAGARARGIATVFQEVLSVPGSSITDNVWLGAKRAGTTAAHRRRRAAELLEGLLGRPVDVGRPAETLSLSERQACCVARALVADPKVLVLDESTSALDIATRDRLFAAVRELTARGASVLFVSHRMDEIFAISDVVTVLRSGTTVASRIPIGDTSAADLVRHMTGASIKGGARGRDGRAAGVVALRADGIRLKAGGQPVDVTVHAGEIMGLAGLEGHGQDLFLKALRGLRVPGGGRVTRVDGETAVHVDGPRAARRHGIAYVPRERRGEGMFEQLSIWENFGLTRLRHDAVAGVVSPRRTARRLAEYGGPLRVKMRHYNDPIATLSGGNQQKVIIARALADHPSILLLNDPARGVDLSAKQDLYEALHELCAAGTAIVVLSTEVDELVQLADRVIVFRDHEAVAEIPRSALSREAIVAAYFGAIGANAPAPDGTAEGKADATNHAASDH